MNPTTPESSQPTAPAAEVPGIARVTDIRPPSEPKPVDVAPLRMPGGSASRPPLPKSTVLGEMVGKLLGLVAGVLSPAFVEKSLTAARTVGQYAVLAGAGLTLLYAIFAAIKFNSFAMFITGLGFIAALAVAQFAATRFLHAADTTITNTPSRVSSNAFLECAGLLVLLFAAATLVGGIITAIQLGSFAAFVPAVLITAALGYFGAVALHPRLVNVTTGEGSAGEEAIGLLSFFFKTGLKLVPLFFCLLAVGGCIAILASFFQAGQALASVISSVTRVIPLPVSETGGLGGAAVVLLACLLPILSYFVFLLQYLMLDVLRAVLSVPGKLDALKR